MNPLIGASLISGGASLLGGILGNRAASAQAARAMDFSASEAQKGREFAERMSSTAHQREVEDLRAAGLNPILSATRGASAPSSPVGSGFAAPQHDVVTPAVSSAAAVARLGAEIKNIEAQTESTRAITERTRAQTGVIEPAARVGRAATSAWDTAMELGNKFQRWATDKLMGLYNWSAREMRPRARNPAEPNSAFDLRRDSPTFGERISR